MGTWATKCWKNIFRKFYCFGDKHVIIYGVYSRNPITIRHIPIKICTRYPWNVSKFSKDWRKRQWCFTYEGKLWRERSRYLGAFAKLRKGTICFVMSRLPMEGFLWNLIFEYFRKHAEKIKVSLKSDFTWRPIYIFDHISISASHNEKGFRQSLYRKWKHTFCVQNFFFFVNRTDYELGWKNIVQPARPLMTLWRMRIACWIHKATDKHSVYVTLIACPLTASVV